MFSGKKIIGLDIGSSSIKMAEVLISRKGAELLSFSFTPTPPNAISGGEIQDAGSLGASIQSALMELKSKRKYVGTAMWGTAVIVKKITIPRMDKKIIADQLRFEAEQYIPFDISNVTLAHHLLKTTSSPETMELILVAAQNELISQYKNVIDNIGLRCGLLDVAGFALANTFELNYGIVRNETVGVLNFGAAITNFVVLHDGEVLFCRDIPVGGQNYTNEISKGLGVSLQEAEALKLSASEKKEVPDEVHSLISATNEAITEEIKNSLEFLSATTNGLNLNRCYITGGAHVTPGLSETIQRLLNFPVEVFNPFRKVKVNNKRFNQGYLQQIKSFLPVVMGLALREVGDS